MLDTGIDLTHPDMEARLDNIKGKCNWTNQRFKNLVQDKNGHGTFTAGLILDYMPDAELYVAKIADNKPSSPTMIAEVSHFLPRVWCSVSRSVLAKASASHGLRHLGHWTMTDKPFRLSIMPL